MTYSRVVLFCCYTLCSGEPSTVAGDLPSAIACFSAAEQKWNAADFKACAEQFQKMHQQSPNENTAYWSAVSYFHLAQLYLYGTTDIRDNSQGNQALERSIAILEAARAQYPQHAEMQAITSAANFLGGKYLKDCTIYVTLEPCVMCAGALTWAQISKVVIGARDENRGFINKKLQLHPKTEIITGILEADCSSMVKDFFKEKR